MKKKFTLCLSLALIFVMLISGTFAYLTSTDSDVNVMTLGNVDIEQIEEEWNDTGDELQDFTQEKPLYPYVGELGWEEVQEGYEAYHRLSMENVVDKYVSVKNTGKSEAYVRTIFAFEMGDFSLTEFKNFIGISSNKKADTEALGLHWMWEEIGVSEIDGQNYYLLAATYDEKLAPEMTTIPSLLQIYLSKDATNETAEKIDGNTNEVYEVLAISQAVQAEGFADAVTALDTAFGEITKTNHPWKMEEEFVDVTSAEELEKQLAAGNDVRLKNNISVSDPLTIVNSSVLNLNGFMITGNVKADESVIDNYAELTVKNGAVNVTTSDVRSTIYNCGSLNLIDVIIQGVPQSIEEIENNVPDRALLNYGSITGKDSWIGKEEVNEK